MRRKIKNKGKLADSSSALEIQKQKMKSIATPKLEVDLSNQILISSGIDAIQKFNQLSKGICVYAPRLFHQLYLKSSVCVCVCVFFFIIRVNFLIKSGKSAVEPSNDNTDQMDVDVSSDF